MNDEILKELKYNGAMLEEIRSQNEAILEGQKDQASHADIDRLEQRLDTLESDVKVIKAAVKDVGRDLAEHKRSLAHVAHRHA